VETSWPPTLEPRTRQLKVRLTDGEFRRLAHHAESADLSVSELVRVILPLNDDAPPVATSGASAKTDRGGLDAQGYRGF
jgi:hypothetical protein